MTEQKVTRKNPAKKKPEAVVEDVVAEVVVGKPSKVRVASHWNPTYHPFQKVLIPVGVFIPLEMDNFIEVNLERGILVIEADEVK